MREHDTTMNLFARERETTHLVQVDTPNKTIKGLFCIKVEHDKNICERAKKYL